MKNRLKADSNGRVLALKLLTVLWGRKDVQIITICNLLITFYVSGTLLGRYMPYQWQVLKIQ